MNHSKKHLQQLIDGYKAVLARYEFLVSIGHQRGLCDAINTAEIDYRKINAHTRAFLHEHFANNKPSPKQHQEFFRHHYFSGHAYWWTSNKIGQEQRILFVKHLIKQLEDEQIGELQKETQATPTSNVP